MAHPNYVSDETGREIVRLIKDRGGAPTLAFAAGAAARTVATLSVQSGASNTFGYPARVESWDATTAALSDLATTEVRVKDYTGGTFTAGDKINNARFLGINSSGVACFAAAPLAVAPYHAGGAQPVSHTIAAGANTTDTISGPSRAGVYLVAGQVAFTATLAASLVVTITFASGTGTIRSPGFFGPAGAGANGGQITIAQFIDVTSSTASFTVTYYNVGGSGSIVTDGFKTGFEAVGL